MLPRTGSLCKGAIAALGVVLGSTVCHADDWPQWQGPTRNGVWKETGLTEFFPKDGPKVLWRKPIKPGYSGPAVVGGKVYVTDRIADAVENDKPQPKGGIPGKERVLCLDAKTGDQVWSHEYDCTYVRVNYPSGPRTTPVVEGGKVYVLGAMGNLVCLDAANGKPVWDVKFKDDAKTPTPVWGFSSHVLVDDKHVYALVGGEGKAVMAWDKQTGKEVWKALDSAEVGYSPPMLVQAGGTTQLIVWLSDKLCGLNPKTGEVFWKIKHPAEGQKQMRPSVTITAPLVVGNRVYVSSAYDGALCVELAKDKPEAKVVWQAKDIYPKNPEKLPTLMSSLLIKDGHLYGVSAGSGEVMCSKADTGETVWQDPGLFKGKEVVFGTAFWVEYGSKQMAFTDTGDLVILDLNPKEYKELSRWHAIDPVQGSRGRKVVWAHPAFANKCAYIRNDNEIICVDLSKS